jgi:hypothetical protein
LKAFVSFCLFRYLKNPAALHVVNLPDIRTQLDQQPKAGFDNLGPGRLKNQFGVYYSAGKERWLRIRVTVEEVSPHLG